MTSEEIRKNSLSLIAFAKINGKPSIAPCKVVDSDTGEERHFKSLAFTHPTEVASDGKHKVTFVSFSKKLGELTSKQLVEWCNKLHVLKYKTDSGKTAYSLWKDGESSWEEVALPGL